MATESKNLKKIYAIPNPNSLDEDEKEEALKYLKGYIKLLEEKIMAPKGGAGDYVLTWMKDVFYEGSENYEKYKKWALKHIDSERDLSITRGPFIGNDDRSFEKIEWSFLTRQYKVVYYWYPADEGEYYPNQTFYSYWTVNGKRVNKSPLPTTYDIRLDNNWDLLMTNKITNEQFKIDFLTNLLVSNLNKTMSDKKYKESSYTHYIDLNGNPIEEDEEEEEIEEGSERDYVLTWMKDVFYKGSQDYEMYKKWALKNINVETDLGMRRGPFIDEYREMYEKIEWLWLTTNFNIILYYNKKYNADYLGTTKYAYWTLKGKRSGSFHDIPLEKINASVLKNKYQEYLSQKITNDQFKLYFVSYLITENFMRTTYDKKYTTSQFTNYVDIDGNPISEEEEEEEISSKSPPLSSKESREIKKTSTVPKPVKKYSTVKKSPIVKKSPPLSSKEAREVDVVENKSLQRLLGNGAYICTNEGLENSIIMEVDEEVLLFGYSKDLISEKTILTKAKLQNFVNYDKKKNKDALKLASELGLVLSDVQTMVDSII